MVFGRFSIPNSTCTMYITSHSNCMNFWANIMTPTDYSPWSEREILLILSPKLEKPHLQKLVCMHLTSVPTCMNFFSQFYLIQFFTTMDYSPWSERKIWPKLKVAILPKSKKTLLIKIGVHAFDINLYMHEFFESILFNSIFVTTMVWKGNLAKFES